MGLAGGAWGRQAGNAELLWVVAVPAQPGLGAQGVSAAYLNLRQ